jgi:hypothetical protein
MRWPSKKVVVLVAAATAPFALADEPRVSIGIPAESEAGCFTRTLRIPAGTRAAQLPDVASVEFTVGADGSVAGILTEGARPLLATQLRRAVTMCAWIAAADARGVPKALRVRLPVRFSVHEARGNVARLDVARATVVAVR